MRVVSLISGGKDSTFNMMSCIAEGHEIVALANLHPDSGDELDSFMYQTVGHMGIEMYAQAMDLPLFREKTSGKTSQGASKAYKPDECDEVEDLYRLLSKIKESIEFDGVCCGCILSDYQRIRCENVCARLNLKCFSYLYRRDQAELLQEMVDSKLDAILIKVACLGLNCADHLGKSISEVQGHLMTLYDKFGCNVCGEGGEYETFTLDCPLFKKRIVIDDSEKIVTNNSDPKWTVGHMNFLKMHLEEKSDMEKPKVKNSDDFIKEYLQSNAIPMVRRREMESEKLPEADGGSVDDWLWITVEGSGDTTKEGFISALEKVDVRMAEKNFKINQSVYVVMYISDMSSYLSLNETYNEKFHFQNPPPRICVETCLPAKCQIILEILFYRNPEKVESFHVQGISHWAAANIGPYSQLKTIKDLTLISGQIGLVPGSLDIVAGGIENENKLALRHIERVVKAVERDSDSSVFHAVCYLVRAEDIPVVQNFWRKQCDQKDICTNYVVVSALPRNALVEWQVYYHKSTEIQLRDFLTRKIGSCFLYMRITEDMETSCFSATCQLAHNDGIQQKHVDDATIAGVVDCLSLNFSNIIVEGKFKLQVKVFARHPEYETSSSLLKQIEKVFAVGNVNFSIIPVKFLENDETFLTMSVFGFRI